MKKEKDYLGIHRFLTLIFICITGVISYVIYSVGDPFIFKFVV